MSGASASRTPKPDENAGSTAPGDQIRKMLDDHALGLGRIVGTLHSLETAIRLHLRRAENDGRLDSPEALVSLQVGAAVDETAFTNYDTLEKLIKSYKGMVLPECQVDAAVVSLRDALAHGRVFGSSATKMPHRLLKFERPKNGKTEVAYSELLDSAWFEKTIAWVDA
jgi:hypothetical protein